GALALAAVALGLASRRYGAVLPDAVAAYAGDVLWAALVFGLAALVRPGARTRTLAAAALVVAFAVEAGQLVHAPWLDALRATRAGALVLGRGFLWSDLACYAAGVAGAAALDRLLTARRRPSGPVLRRETDEPAHGGDAAARS
ncbi:MAG TPA: DUF2809 domain-containing protein, partial [Rubricoccaceae bacterium]